MGMAPTRGAGHHQGGGAGPAGASVPQAPFAVDPSLRLLYICCNDDVGPSGRERNDRVRGPSWAPFAIVTPGRRDHP